MDNVLGVEFKVEPRAAVWNNPAGEKKLARGMGLALVVVKEHSGRAVHLGNDHTLGAVHDERTVRCHQRHVAHEDVLFLDVLDRFRAGVFVNIKHDQAQSDLQRSTVGHVALLTFLDVILRLFQFVFHELEHRGLVEILDRENRLKHAHDAFTVGGLDGVFTGVQEQVIARLLNFDEVRHFQHFVDFAVVFAESLLAKIGRRHACDILVFKHISRRRERPVIRLRSMRSYSSPASQSGAPGSWH